MNTKASQYKPEVNRKGTVEATNKINIENLFAILNRQEDKISNFINSVTAGLGSGTNIYLDSVWDLYLDADRDTWIDAPVDDHARIMVNSTQIAGIYSDVIGNQILTVAGSTAAPSYSFLLDRDTGFYNSALNVLSVAIAGALDFSFAANRLNVLAGSDINITDLTPSTVLQADASKNIESIANGAGYLQNDGAGGLSWTTPALITHNILSVSHPDTTPGACATGDLICGIAGKWDRLADVAVGSVLISGGLLTAPSWSTSLGLGITAATNLHVYENNADTTPACIVEQQGTGDAAIQVIFTGGHAWTFGIDKTDNLFKLNYGTSLGAANHLSINSNGFVGIGTVTPNPGYLFHVRAADGVSDNTYVAYFSNEEATANRNSGIWIHAGSGVSDYNIRCDSYASTPLWSVTGAGLFTINSLTANTIIYSNGSSALVSLPNTGSISYLRNDGAGGLSWVTTTTSTAHDIFSTIHGDTTGAASPVDGDIIIGNVTPKWSKLAITVPAAGTCNYLGVNNSELRPSWKSATSTPGTSATILQTDATGLLNFQNAHLEVANPVDNHDAVNISYILNTIPVSLNYYLEISNIMSTTYNVTTGDVKETPTSTPQTLVSIYFKSAVADTPTPFVLKNGTEFLIHFNARVTTTTGVKTCKLSCQLFYVDSDGVSNPVQIGLDTNSSPDLSGTYVLQELYGIVTSEVHVPAGKRLWIKFIATCSGAPVNYPEIWIQYGGVHNHVSFPVSGSVFGNFLQLSGGTMSGKLYVDHIGETTTAHGIVLDNNCINSVGYFDSKNYYYINNTKIISIDGTNNVMIGESAGGGGVSTNGVHLGFRAGFSTLAAGTHAFNMGSLAGYSQTTAVGCVNIGASAGYSNVSGNSNVNIGYLAGYTNVASYNVNIGTQAGELANNAAATTNVNVGFYSGHANLAGASIVAIGAYALQKNLASYATGVGYQVMYNTTNSAESVAVGDYALYTNVTGKNVTAVGGNAGYYSVLDGGVYLGFCAGVYETCANKLFIDNAARASEADGRIKSLIYGVFAAAPSNQIFRVNAECELYQDSLYWKWGAGGDAGIMYDGTNMNFNSRIIGTGDYVFNGGKIGIGAAPTYLLDGRLDQDADTNFRVWNNTSNTNAMAALVAKSNTASGGVYAFSSLFGVDAAGQKLRDKLVLYSESTTPTLAIIARGTTSDLQFYTGGYDDAYQRCRITYDGNHIWNSYNATVNSKFNFFDSNSLAAGYQNLVVQTTDAYAIDKGGSIGFGGAYRASGIKINFGAISGRKANATDVNYAGYLSLYSSVQGVGLVEGIRITELSNVTIPAGSLQVSTGFGCNSKTPQVSYASGGALAAYGAGTNGLDTEANMSALHTLVVNMRAALVANGIMS